MKKEDIKVGETYNVRVKVHSKPGKNIVAQTVDKWGMATLAQATVFTEDERRAFFPLPSEPPTLVGSQSKYDPCRKFRKGDIVEPTEINGRFPQELLGCYRYEVIVREGDMSNPHYVTLKPLLAVNSKHLSEIHVNVVFLKLVTPIEEKYPYSIETCQYGYTVNKGELILATYNDENHPHAKEAAETERDRLNAEYRKEQK